MFIKLSMNIKTAICFLLVLCLFFYCATPRGGQMVQERNTDEDISEQKSDSLRVSITEFENTMTVQQNDSIQTFITDEEIKKEMKWGPQENIGSYLVGVIFGFIIGASIGASANAVITKPAEDEALAILPGLVIGSFTGSVAGSIISHKLIYNKEKKEAEKRLLKKQKYGNHIKIDHEKNN